ncbi:MAG: hypothetical protein ACI4KA_08920 [Oscillospiraceae bacterium]
MSKRIISVMLAAALLISYAGCSTDETDDNSPSTVEITDEATTDADSAESVENSKSDDSSQAEESGFTAARLESFSAWLKDGDRNLLESQYDKLADDITQNYSDGVKIASDLICFRTSSCALKSSEEELSSAVSAIPFSPTYDGGYALEADDARLYLSAGASGDPELASVYMQYTVPQEITLAGFLKKEGAAYRFVIDPAYTIGLPMLTSRTEYMQFDINGRDIYADTLSVLVSPADGSAPDIGEDYVYANLVLSDLVVGYDTVSGYANTGSFGSVDILSKDTDTVIDYPYLFNADGKDAEMAEVYSTIVDNIGELYKDNTHGMVLLDMDFDGKPELLLSDKVATESANKYGYDTSVYRIEDGALRYTGKMTIATEYMTTGPVLGLKNCADGTKGWYVSSYINRETGSYDEKVDYIYTLDGDTLIAAEKFRSHNYEDYYIDGEQITIQSHEEYLEFYDEPELMTVYEWNGYSSCFSPNVMFGDVKYDFVEDITEQYLLLSDWLCGFNYEHELRAGRVTDIDRLTDRELSYRIAYLVDSVYLGDYDVESKRYYYEFYGGLAKPVIYLYPEEKTEVSVEVDFAHGGRLTCTYPEYDNGWTVTAMPDGTLYDNDGSEYYCLYWEGEGSADLDMSRGWCVKGSDTAAFLREKLMYIGLSAREANEFIIYWLPLMQENEYNLISLHTEQYKASVPLKVSPAPDSEIRVFMTFTPAEEYVDILPQQLPTYERTGFTLVEWGGGMAER